MELQRKNTERDLALLAAIVESSDDAILSCDLNGKITSWNRSAERIFGYIADEILGCPTSILASARCQEDTERVLDEVRHGRKVDHYETWRRHKDGTDVMVSITVSPICDPSGTLIGASKVSRDITAIRRAEDVLRNTDKLALVGRMAASIAHEINNPLESVTNLLYLAEHESISDEARSYLTLAQHELARVSHIVSQTLGFFRNTRGTGSVALREIIDSALSLHLGRLSTSNVVVRKEYASLSPQLVHQGELRQVIVNLIGNALDAMSRGGRLRLRVRPAWDPVTGTRGARIVIADNGSGISPETLRQIFEPFFTTKGAAGTGLGLWVSSQIISRHKGRISVRSSQSPAHRGTVFSIFLPDLSEAPSSEMEESSESRLQRQLLQMRGTEANEREDESRHTPSELDRQSAAYNAA
ncbi:nitrogen regulation protein NR(II) [Edaphobacter sp. 12200R-103]|uniref:two-component system sensor histidine kinase NtrB n=1 Tax=Edaphobacter sp. 12200R-103 TaxID=2703788 RepID=UPI00138B637D|nr:PAS domain S-box protein [Edaphobacter sp. 12200R-103]QHS51507.1 PAS domain S-box protein [Edaphobacter sp. 12200R-103]